MTSEEIIFDLLQRVWAAMVINITLNVVLVLVIAFAAAWSVSTVIRHMERSERQSRELVTLLLKMVKRNRGDAE